MVLKKNFMNLWGNMCLGISRNQLLKYNYNYYSLIISPFGLPYIYKIGIFLYPVNPIAIFPSFV